LAQAQAQLQISLDKLEEMADGPDPDALALAEARLANAEARLALAETGAGPEQLSQAQAGIDAAQAVLDLAAIQLERTEVKAPVAGTILFSNVEIGEVVIPSAILMTLGQLDELTLTVYLPEDRYGSVQLGDVVEVTVDSFPDERFEATVVRIADEAEFTPRNVQTQEGRRTTVFGIELRVTNAQNRLKPGMPADVDFTP
jgi:multidrug resistance efflux pump